MNVHTAARTGSHPCRTHRDRSTRCSVQHDFQPVTGSSQAALVDRELIDRDTGDGGVRQIEMHAIALTVRDGARVEQDGTECRSDRREIDADGTAAVDVAVAGGDIGATRDTIQDQVDAGSETGVDDVFIQRDVATDTVVQHQPDSVTRRAVVDGVTRDVHVAGDRRPQQADQDSIASAVRHIGRSQPVHPHRVHAAASQQVEGDPRAAGAVRGRDIGEADITQRTGPTDRHSTTGTFVHRRIGDRDVKAADGSGQHNIQAVATTVGDRAARDRDRRTTGVHTDGDARRCALVDNRIADGHPTE